MVLENDEKHDIYGGVDGLIIEINENVDKFIKEEPETKGYIAIVSVFNR